jgi:hypothetical protein
MNTGNIATTPKQKVLLEFGHTPNSPNYTHAVELARNISTYRQAGSGSQLRHIVALTESEGNQWIQLYAMVKDWKASRISYGKISSSANRHEWTFRCYLDRCQASDKEAHCFTDNWIGCRKITEGHTLFLYRRTGRFVSKDKFEPNKDAIKQNILEDLNSYGLCPSFDLTCINAQIDKLTLLIELHDASKWRPVIESDYTDKVRLAGIALNIHHESFEGPVIEDIDELDEFGIHRYGVDVVFRKAWEHKVLVVDHNTWLSGAQAGTIPDLERFGLKGWQLVTVVHVDDEWHCILQRAKPE